MKKLVLATLVGLTLVSQVAQPISHLHLAFTGLGVTLAPQIQSQSQPISKFRLAKEYALGFWDYLYGKFYLTRNQNYLRNVVAGYEGKKSKAQALQIFERLSNCAQEQKNQKVMNAIRINDVRGAFGMIEQNC